ncbi:MAG: hypothetical protein HYY05_05765, partial [Chloroflexi bacterium]|nr:hypothetical protein [Chloroflexota bacterium]
AVLLVAAVSWAIAPLQGYEFDDMQHYKRWLLLVTSGGISSAYSGEYPQSYAIYPPGFLYPLRVIGLGWRAFVDPSLDLQTALASNALSIAIKSSGLIFHVLLTLGLVLIHRARYGVRGALATGLLYGLNPAVLFDVAYWGHPDAMQGFFLLVGLVAVDTSRPLAGGALLGLAAWTKPQTWALLPLAAALAWRRGRQGGLGKAGVAFVGVSALVLSPFWRHGTLSDLATLPERIASVMPFTSVYGNNLWWLLVSWGRLEVDPPWLPDSDPWIGSLSYATWGYLLFGGVMLWGLWALTRTASRETALEVVAFVAFGFFMLVTKVHENHAFQALVILAGAGLLRGHRLAIYAALSLTLLVNMALFTPDIHKALLPAMGRGGLMGASMVNAAANLGLFAVWLALLMRSAAGAPAPGRGDRPVAPTNAPARWPPEPVRQ